MTTTLREVARQAGVSVSTVSRVIRNTGYIAAPTRQKVLSAIESLQYRPNNVARHLRYGRTYVIGFIVTDISNPFFSHAIKGAEQFLRGREDHDFELVLSNTDGEPAREIKAIELMLNKHAEAIILASTADGECVERVKQVVKDYHLPIVSIDNQLDGAEIGIVTAENQSGAQQLTSHLLSHGHKRIGIISGPLQESHVRERLEGSRQALKEYGLDLDSGLVASGNWTVGDGYRITKSWLDSGDPPTAIFAQNNFMCMGALSAIIERGLRVPRDVAIVSFDDVEFGHLLRPNLTALYYPYQKIGEEAVRLALEGIKSEAGEKKHPTVRLPVKLMVRESCGCSF